MAGRAPHQRLGSWAARQPERRGALHPSGQQVRPERQRMHQITSLCVRVRRVNARRALSSGVARVERIKG